MYLNVCLFKETKTFKQLEIQDSIYEAVFFNDDECCVVYSYL
jgi:hypothetical protein